MNPALLRPDLEQFGWCGRPFYGINVSYRRTTAYYMHFLNATNDGLNFLRYWTSPPRGTVAPLPIHTTYSG